MPVLKNGQITEDFVDDEIDYELTSPSRLISTHINSIPIQSGVQSPRLFYGYRFYNQAVNLVNREAPLVQNLDPEDEQGRSFDEIFGEAVGALKADDDYEVLDVTDDRIRLKNPQGQVVEKFYHKALPYNRKSLLMQEPKVKPGDKVTKGGLLATSNYTDGNGVMAMGVNARVGLVPYLGFSMDDAVVISEGFAKRLRSQGMETFKVNREDPHLKLGKDHYVALYPGALTKEQLKTLDDDGVVKPGTILQPGDPVVLATRPRMLSSSTAQLGTLNKAMRESRSDAAELWEGHEPAKVLSVSKTKKGIKVVATYEADAAPGDKIVMRSGGKGTIAKILPDDQMPRGADGKPFEALFNQLTLPSRANASGYFEMMLGKVAAAKGQPLKYTGFTKPNEYWYDVVERALKEAGLSDVEEVYDPVFNQKLEQPIASGNQYILKLQHMAALKTSSRGTGGYTLDELPARGGDDGAKRLSGLETTALKSAGAYGTIREGATIRGQRNDEYWRLLRDGYKPPEPGKPFVWNKFLALLGGAGINVRDLGRGKLRLSPMTEAALEERKPLEVRSAATVDFKTLQPKPGGLFDRALVSGNRWGYIKLPEPMVNPAYEDSVRHLLGLKLKDLQAIAAGEMELPEHLRPRRKNAAVIGEPDAPHTGPAALAAALADVDLDALEAKQHEILRSGKVSKRKDAVKTLHAIAGLKRNNASPKDLLIQRVPVIPPAFRPYTAMGTTFVSGSANELYKDLFDMRDAFEASRKALGDRNVAGERRALHDAVKAVYGFGPPVTSKSQQRNVPGFLQQIVGNQAKFGWVQRKLLSKTQDQVARGVITPNPDLSIDEVGVPEDMAWSMYQNFLRRRLVRQGMPRLQALEHIKMRTPVARQALDKETEERWVIYSRSPAWHRQNVISGKVKLVKGNTIQISPMVAAGLNADYDGDQMNIHVPATDESLEEARTILRPSRMVFSIKDQERIVPELKHEQVLGLYAATQRPAKAVHRFASQEEALKAIRQRKISLSDDVEFPDAAA